jgi:mannose-6-phosphate isomerase-like protein (cupin superfamily)
MDRTPAPVSLAAARGLQPPEGSRAAEVFRDDHVWIRFAARPTSGPQVPHDRDEFYIVASGIARYRWDSGETMIGPGDMMFAAAHTPHGEDPHCSRIGAGRLPEGLFGRLHNGRRSGS